MARNRTGQGRAARHAGSSGAAHGLVRLRFKPKLPVISGREARRAFERDGWRFSRQRGSHMILVKAGIAANLSIPDHRELDRGLLRGLIRDRGPSVDEFMRLVS